MGLGEDDRHRSFERQAHADETPRRHRSVQQRHTGYYPQDLKPFGKTVRRGHNGDNFGVSGKENFQEFTNYPRSIIKFQIDKEKLHPTQKPVALMEYMIRTYTQEGATVLDNTMGSGSTGVACVNTGRSFIGIELSEKYFE